METRHITYDCQNKSIGVTFALDNEADTVQWQTGYIHLYSPRPPTSSDQNQLLRGG